MLLLNSIQNKIIFVAALDWGMGHLSRTAAIVRQLSKNNEIILFTTPQQAPFYSILFPNLKQLHINSYGINFYPTSNIRTFIYSISFFTAILKEKKILDQCIKKKLRPDLILSDNRYGFYHPDIKSVFITHQINLPSPKWLSAANLIHQTLYKPFHELWVPDYGNATLALAGKLSHPEKIKTNIPVYYIHPCSLMQKKQIQKDIDYLFIISGTKAERHYFEKIFEAHATQLHNKNKDLHIKIIGGYKKNNTFFLAWKNFQETNELMCRSKNIVSRAGYSTLMDWHAIQDDMQTLYLTPTPYQLEQQYLYHYWIKKGWAQSINNIML